MFYKVSTVSIMCKDKDKVRDTYVNVLGLDPPIASTDYAVGRYTEHSLVIDDILLELLQPLDGPEAPGPGGGMARFLQRRGEGLYLITVRVDTDDLAGYCRGLEAKGVKVYWDVPDYGDVKHGQARPPTPAGSIHPLIHPRYTHGVLWELGPRRFSLEDEPRHASPKNAFKKVKTISIMCKDNDAALKTYTEVLGLGPPVRSMIYEKGRFKEHALAIGDIALELLQPLDGPDAPGPGGGMARFLQRHGEGLFFVTVDVEDPEKYAKGLEAKGVKVYWDVVDYGEVIPGALNPNYTPPPDAVEVHPFIHPGYTHGVMWELSRYGSPLATI